MQRTRQTTARLANIEDWQAFAPMSLSTLTELVERPTRRHQMYGEEYAIETKLDQRLRTLRAHELAQYRHGSH